MSSNTYFGNSGQDAINGMNWGLGQPGVLITYKKVTYMILNIASDFMKGLYKEQECS